MSHPCNQWYVDGFGDDLKPGEMLDRTYLGENVVLFRTQGSTQRALADGCLHRFALLASDAPAMRARRMLQAAIEEELG
jgi:vanillate O-demethylase monooxygenase subunit